MNFLSVGHLIIDEVITAEGMCTDRLIGGPALFGAAGVKIWTDECGVMAHVGADFYEYFGKWFADNHMSTLCIDVLADHCHRHRLTYRPDNTYACEVVTGRELRGYLRVRASDLAQLPSNVSGLYITLESDVRMWELILREKRRKGLQIMWEIEPSGILFEKRDDIKAIAQQLEMFSLNIEEASLILGIPQKDEYELLHTLAGWDVPFIFFRVGKRGSYAIFDRKWVFLPSVGAGDSVDSTGCGNCSTAAAAYGYCRTGDPVTAGIMGNISACFNARQTGMIPLITPQMRTQAKEMLADYFRTYNVQPGYDLGM